MLMLHISHKTINEGVKNPIEFSALQMTFDYLIVPDLI